MMSVPRFVARTARTLTEATSLTKVQPAASAVTRCLSTALGTTPAKQDKAIIERYQRLMPRNGDTMVTYVWIDGTREGLRAKTKILSKEPERAEDCPKWSYDGSSTGQAAGEDSDVYLVPAALYPDPFNPGRHKLLMCETFDSKMKPHPDNLRFSCNNVMGKAATKEPWFGIEQEYTMLKPDGAPLGWPSSGGVPKPQGPYYCSVGAAVAIGRDVCESHLYASLYAGIRVCGTNAEVMPGQWEYQVGPCEGISMGDDLWMSRYIMLRVAEEYGVVITFDPKPMEGDWNGAGAHINFDYKDMRQGGKDPRKEIDAAISKLAKNHARHIRAYDPHGGKDNERRLTGLHETSSITDFSAGVAHRGCSIRIPRQVEENGYGYIEDRRPSSNCDPYAVTEALVRTCILNE